MKKLILTFGIFLAGILCVTAQDKGTAKMVDHINQVCGLTPDQVSKVQPIVENYEKARKANKQQFANDPAGLKGANKSARENYKSQLKAVHTPDQQAKMKAYNEQHKKGGQGEEPEGQEHQ